MKLGLGLVTGLIVVSSVHANSARTLPFNAKEELGTFKLPTGFTIDLVASEEDGLVKPIDLSFDDAGRLWTQTATMYPMDPEGSAEKKQQALDLYKGKTRGRDKILIIPDPYKKVPAKPIVWADGLAMPQSILPYKDGAYVAQGSELFFLQDTNGDGKADKRVPLLSGFGVADTHTMPHALVRAPGGWVHFSHGALNKGEVISAVSGAKLFVGYSKILRMSMDGAKLNLVGSGLNNIWGFQLRDNGQWYGTEANDLSWSVTPMEEGTGFWGIGSDRLRPYQPWVPELHQFRVGGTGISGLAFAEDQSGSFPKEWRDVALLANPITSAVNAVRIVRNADGSVTAAHLPDLVTSSDNWFRPVHMEFGPDGCLYIADWYNKIISHNEVALDHPGRDKSRGRIWRVCYKGAAPRHVPNLYQTKNGALVRHLQSPSLWEKRAAWHQIVDRGAKELAPGLVALAGDRSKDTTSRIHALWSLEGLRQYDAKLMGTLLKSSDDELRREATRALGSMPISAAALADALKGLLNDGNAMVRSQALRTIMSAEQVNDAGIDLIVSFCRPDLPGNAMGGPYERKFERYLARMALERYQTALAAYLRTPQAKQQPVANLFWAVQALPPAQRDAQFLALWPELRKRPLDQAGFISIAQMLGNPQVVMAVKPLFDDTRNAAVLAGLAKDSYESVQSPQLAGLLRPSVRRLILAKDKALLNLGLDVAGKLKVPELRNEVIGILRSPELDEKISSMALAVLDQQPKENEAVVAEVAGRTDISFELKLRALSSLALANPVLVRKKLLSEIKTMDAAQRRALTGGFAGSPHGAQILLELLDAKSLTYADFTRVSASYISIQRPDDGRSKALSAAIKHRDIQEKLAIQAKVQRLTQLARKKGGDPAAGKAFFDAVCLACHVVGGKGAGFAPALDGSAHRDDESLLTATLDPDAAIEESYRIYHVVKNDGTIVEGYLQQKDPRGATLKFMGGGEVFIAAADIKEQTFVYGRSVMPRGLIDSLPDAQVENLLAYIRTLK